MADIIEEAAEELVGVVHKATDPQNRKRNVLWIVALLGIFGVNPAADYFSDNSGGISPEIVTQLTTASKNTMDSVAILTDRLSDHITFAEGKMDDFMEQLEYQDIKQSVERQIDRRQVWIRGARKEIDGLDLSEFRRRTEDSFSIELLKRYNTERRDLRDEIDEWQGEIRDEQLKLL